METSRADQSTDDAGKSFGLGDLDAGDGSVSVGRAHEDQMQHAQHLDVVDEFALAADQASVFLALDRLADPVPAVWQVVVAMISFGRSVVAMIVSRWGIVGRG